MGNCFKLPSHDNASLLRDPENSDRTSRNETSQVVAHRPTDDVQQHRGPAHYSIASRSTAQVTEDEQIKRAKRIGLIQHLPTGYFDGSKKTRECAICMGDFTIGDSLRYLPCMHTYHKDCIDDWLMRSFVCPSCMEPVESALLMTYYTH